MASRKFRFVSPGVFLKEIDNSQLPRTPEGMGPVIIGRTRKGPTMKPYKIRSLAEFERVFGKPMPGNQGEDPWRDGTNILAESYAPYAAHAYLSAEIDSPVTVVRLGGITGDNAKANGEPGWTAETAHGLFLFESSSAAGSNRDLKLSAIFYGSNADFEPKLKGASLSGSGAVHTADAGTPVRFNAADRLTIDLRGGGSKNREVAFKFGEIREDFNTNPVATNLRISTAISGTLSDQYWLGESFQEVYDELSAKTSGTAKCAVMIKLNTLMSDFKSTKHELTAARSGWVIGQDTSASNSSFDIDNHQRLFRVVALHEGSAPGKDLIIGIEDIKIPREGATNPFGSFSLVVKRIGVTKVEEIERFDSCNLDPTSQNFIAKKIGDQYLEWSPSEKRNKIYGNNPNISEYIRIELNEDILSNGGPTNNAHVPFGFYGPIKPKTVSGSTSSGKFTGAGWLDTANVQIKDEDASDSPFSVSWPSAPLVATGSAEDGFYMGATPFKQTIAADTSVTVSSQINRGYIDYSRRLAQYDSSNSLVTLQDSGIVASNSEVAEYSYKFSLDEVVLVPNEGTAISAVTSANDVQHVYYEAGSKLATPSEGSITFTGNPAINQTVTLISTDGTSITYSAKTEGNSAARTFDANNGPEVSATTLKAAIEDGSVGGGHGGKILVEKVTVDGGVKLVLTQAQLGADGDREIASTLANTTKVDFTGGALPPNPSYSAQVATDSTMTLRPLLEIVEGFHMPLVGGFDGVNIVEADPFNNKVLEDGTTADNYAFASIDRAIELIKDPEAIEHNLAVMPGITNESLTTKLVNTCEARADSLAIIDLPDVYIPPFQRSCDNFKERVSSTTPERTAAAIVRRQLNSSYAACYYPWVKVKDEEFNRDVWVPPSVVALGVMAYTEKTSEVWFAPAGFNRGGLNQGNAGLPVLQVSEQLLSKDRDRLYEANVNPVASFVSEGIVIFGQKTLQSTQSALDRINVRRLLIFIKKEVSRISNTLLFEQNVQATWNRFISRVVPFLDSIKVRFGLSDFKVVLDGTTTTPDLIDRNIMYAKIFLKPARSIEFIAVDFVITNTGASFAD
tara:strand:- start:2633 stop:5866 length:3234 start_codon:yes stop_codon:yes gene_type:complete